MAKWPNHFISSKLFQKRPNGNPDDDKRMMWKREGGGVENARVSVGFQRAMEVSVCVCVYVWSKKEEGVRVCVWSKKEEGVCVFVSVRSRQISSLYEDSFRRHLSSYFYFTLTFILFFKIGIFSFFLSASLLLSLSIFYSLFLDLSLSFFVFLFCIIFFLYDHTLSLSLFNISFSLSLSWKLLFRSFISDTHCLSIFSFPLPLLFISFSLSLHPSLPLSLPPSLSLSLSLSLSNSESLIIGQYVSPFLSLVFASIPSMYTFVSSYDDRVHARTAERFLLIFLTKNIIHRMTNHFFGSRS